MEAIAQRFSALAHLGRPDCRPEGPLSGVNRPRPRVTARAESDPKLTPQSARLRAICPPTVRQFLIYNVPYRTSVNLTNETLLRLAELPNVVGVKDSSGSISQSLDLLAARPAGFSVLTGDDALFFPLLCCGADGGILASAHVATDRFVDIAQRVTANDHFGARAIWEPLQQLVPKLFQEANPMPIKHCLWRQGLIASPECRLPLSSVSVELGGILDRLLGDLWPILAANADGRGGRYQG